MQIYYHTHQALPIPFPTTTLWCLITILRLQLSQDMLLNIPPLFNTVLLLAVFLYAAVGTLAVTDVFIC